MNKPDYKPPRAIDKVIQDAYNYTFITDLSYEKWLLTAKNLYKNAQQKQKSGLKPEAYVSYLRFIDLMLNKIPTHPDFKDRSSYRTLKNIALNLDGIINELKLAVIKEREDYINKRRQERLNRKQKELSVILEVEKSTESEVMKGSEIIEPNAKHEMKMVELEEAHNEDKVLGNPRKNENINRTPSIKVTEILEFPDQEKLDKKDKNYSNSMCISENNESPKESHELEHEIPKTISREIKGSNEKDILMATEVTNLTHTSSVATSNASLIKDINDDYSIGGSVIDRPKKSHDRPATLDPRSFKGKNKANRQPTIFKNYLRNRQILNGGGSQNKLSDEEIAINPFSDLSDCTDVDETLKSAIACDSQGKTMQTKNSNIEGLSCSFTNDDSGSCPNKKEIMAQEGKIYSLSDATDPKSQVIYGTIGGGTGNIDFRTPENINSSGFIPITSNMTASNPYKDMVINTDGKYRIDSVSFINTPVNDRGFKTHSSEHVSPLKVNNADKMNSFIFDDYDNQTIDKDMETMSIPTYPNVMQGFSKPEENQIPQNDALPDIESDVEQVFDNSNDMSSSEGVNAEYLENDIITEGEESTNSKVKNQVVKTPAMYKQDDIKFSNSPISILSPLKPPKLKSTDEIENSGDLEKDQKNSIFMENPVKGILDNEKVGRSKIQLESEVTSPLQLKTVEMLSSKHSPTQQHNFNETANLKPTLLSPITANGSAASVYSSAKSIIVPTKPTIPTITSSDNSATADDSMSKKRYLSPEGLQKIFFPKKIKHKFMDFVKRNTFANLETCGLLCGKLSETSFITITDILIPDQKISSNCCQIINEHSIIKYIDINNLYLIGWIHTHPRQACFLSSIDLHTHFVYQQLLPEAIAVVVAPESNPSMGIFRLTKDIGMKTIQNCREHGFHKHTVNDGESLYVDCLKNLDQKVVISSSLPVSMTDLRKYEYIVKGPKK